MDKNQQQAQQRAAETGQWDKAAAAGKASREAAEKAESATESEAASKRRQAGKGLSQ